MTVVSTAVCSATASAQTEEASREPATNAETQSDTILVEGRRPAVDRTIDGTTYDVRNNPQAGAGTAADVLNTIPSVNVSPDGAVTVRGNSNVQVYVNGRPSAAMNEATLQSMSGGSIASVEVITNPSAKFDANGSTIINLTLRRAQGEGLHSTATANVGDHRRANAALNSSYREDRLSASLNTSLRDDVRFTDIFDDRRLLRSDGSVAARFVTDSHYTPTHRHSANVSASLGYELTPASDLGADLTVSWSSPRNTVHERHQDYGPNGELTSEYDRVRRGTYVGTNKDVSVYYQHRGSQTSGSLKIAAQHGTSGVRSDRTFTTSYNFPVLEPITERVLNQTESRLDRMALDYERPLGTNFRVSVGSEWKRERNRYDNGRSVPRESAPDPASDPFGLTVFEGVQRIAAAYVSLQARSGPWTLQAGARFEDIDIATTVSANAFRNRRRISGMNQSASIARSLGDDQIVVRFSRTLQRFNPRDLNPVVVYVDAQNRSVGNPHLAPQRVTSLEAEYDFQLGAVEGAATIYYRRTDHTIAAYYEFLDDNLLVTTKRNGGPSQSLGFEATLTHRITNDLRYSLSGNLFYADLATLDPSGRLSESRVSYFLQGSLDWTATPNDQLHLGANAQGPSLIPQGRRSGTSAVNLVWRHTVSPKLTLSLTGQSIVLDNRVHTVIRTPGAVNVNDRESGGRAVLLGLSYKFR